MLVSKGEMNLHWRISESGQYFYAVSKTFILRIEPSGDGGERFRVAVVQPHYGSALYRSARTFDLEAAKRECVKQGAKVARRLAREYAAVAERLGGME